MIHETEPTSPDLQSYSSFWDEPAPATPTPHDNNFDAYTAFAVAADL